MDESLNDNITQDNWHKLAMFPPLSMTQSSPAPAQSKSYISKVVYQWLCAKIGRIEVDLCRSLSMGLHHEAYR